jgi:hypothetical protein
VVTSRFPESLQRPFRMNSLVKYSGLLETEPFDAGNWFTVRQVDRATSGNNSQAMTFTTSNLSNASSSFVPTQFQG